MKPVAGSVFLAWGMSSSVPRGEAWLTGGELAVHRALRVPKRASDWRLGRWIGKEAVRRAVGAPELEGSEVEILASSGGAPTVTLFRSGSWPEVHLSLSHAWGMGFAAAVTGPMGVGCDVEAIRPRSDAFVTDYLTAAEAAVVRQADETDQAACANLLWSAKESALKLLGEGLRLDTRSVEVTLGGEESLDGWRTYSVTTPDAGTHTGYWRVTPGFVWTLVTDAPVERIDASPVV